MRKLILLSLVLCLILSGCGTEKQSHTPSTEPVESSSAEVTVEPVVPEVTAGPEAISIIDWLTDRGVSVDNVDWWGTIDVVLNGELAYTYVRSEEDKEAIRVGDKTIIRDADSYFYISQDSCSSIPDVNSDVLAQFLGKRPISFLPVDNYAVVSTSETEILVDRDTSGGYKYYYNSEGFLEMASELPDDVEPVDMTTHFAIDVKDGDVIINVELAGSVLRYYISPVPANEIFDAVVEDTVDSLMFEDVIVEFAEVYTRATQISFNVNAASLDDACGCESTDNPDASCTAGCC